MIIGVLICIFLLTDGVEAFFMCLLAIWRSFVKGPFKSFTYFWFAQFPVSNLPSLTYPSRPLAKPWRDPRQSPWSPAPGGLAAQLAACTFFFFGMPCGMWDLTSQTRELNPRPLDWKHGVLTTGPPGKSLDSSYHHPGKPLPSLLG